MSHKTSYQIDREYPAFQTLKMMAEQMKHRTDGKVFSKLDPACPMTVVSANAHANLIESYNALQTELDQLRQRQKALIAAGIEIIDTARHSLPRKHPTIERNAQQFIPQ